MRRILTTAPIPLELLKLKFTEEVEYVIDYPNSKLKGKVLITYLSNLGINCRLDLPNLEETKALLADYLKAPSLVSIPDLEDIAINLLLERKSEANYLSADLSDFVEEHLEDVTRWERRVDSLVLFAATLPKGCSEVHEGYPVDEDASFAGINFVNLIKHPLFPILIGRTTEADLTYNPVFFKENVFNGRNLFHHFAVKENPLFVTVLALADPEERQKLEEAMVNALEVGTKLLALENPDVSSI